MAHIVDGEEITNRLLLALPNASLEALLPHFKRKEMVHKRVLYRPNDTVRRNYFLERGMVSLVKTMRDGRVVEVNIRGVEGMTAPEALSGANQAVLESVVQIPGEALEIATPILHAAVMQDRAVNELVQRYLNLSTQQLAQTAACNRLHSLEQRCCRWLLIAHDNASADTFFLTHEFLAMMLGVQRPHVSTAAGLLQRAGLIRYGRGRMTILDRAGLEQTSCECHAEMEAEFERLFYRRRPGMEAPGRLRSRARG